MFVPPFIYLFVSEFYNLVNGYAHTVTEQSEGPMDTVAFRDVPPSVLGFDGCISPVIAVTWKKRAEPVGNRFVTRASPHNVLQNFGTVGDSPWPKGKLSHLPVTSLKKTLYSHPSGPVRVLYEVCRSNGSYGPRTEPHGPHTGCLRAPYSPAD